MKRLLRAVLSSRWAPIRKVGAAFLAGLVGWSGWAIWLAGSGDLEAGAALRAGGLAALPVIVAYFVPGRSSPSSS